jgi:Dyp-type peroxidase family
VVIVASDDKIWLAAAVAGLLLTLKPGGLEKIFVQHGATLPDPWRGHEHFGFKDGVSQPGIRGRVSAAPTDFFTRRWIDPADPRSQFFGKPGQLLVWPGEFVLGLPRQQVLTTGIDPAPAASDFPSWAQNGSYFVIRRLRQDFSAFWAFVKARAREAGMPPQKFASLLVGRWSSGAPVMRTPAADDGALAGDDLANNHFLFNRDTTPVPLVPLPDYPGDAFPQARNDFLGQVCPHFAHIRKVNPRDGATDLAVAQDTATRFVLRRGIPYGESLLGVRNPKPAQLKADRGLVFVAYQASITDQFETLVRRWTNVPNQPTPGGHDPIIGQEEVHGSRQRFIDVPGGSRCFLDNEWVIPSGGGYFFAPPISAVRDVLGA